MQHTQRALQPGGEAGGCSSSSLQSHPSLAEWASQASLASYTAVGCTSAPPAYSQTQPETSGLEELAIDISASPRSRSMTVSEGYCPRVTARESSRRASASCCEDQADESRRTGKAPPVSWLGQVLGRNGLLVDLPEEFREKYLVRDVVGRGSSSSVLQLEERASRDGGRPCEYACKVIEVKNRGELAESATRSCKDRVSQSRRTSLENVRREICVLARLQHQNVLCLHEAFLHNDKCFIITPLCTGGTLRDALRARGGRLAEEDARCVMQGILLGLQHMHSKGISHRDLKLENVLIMRPDDWQVTDIRLADFGLSKLLTSENGGEHTVCGTALYMPPEMLKANSSEKARGQARYGMEADVWSCGVILYHLLSGHSPFESASRGVYGLFKAIQSGQWDFGDLTWETVSFQAKDLVRGMMMADSRQRISVNQALDHPW
eukprot:CAMPEP_0117682720 /NCGR_PEP_ID=MMETSP0804-20121206/19866_1 /TAXON_ID=1074897 /ORGANISM="Tetraselmis astigmatica, Strain CCMP880" /LENGTH=436 /DNA_ID=CAMNT_0005492963 /DNA_START=43 /DNA_END=1350 /DNA_ORIENTATION=+